MSRIGRMPVEIPAGVTVTVNGNTVTVKGPKGTLTDSFSERMTITVEDNKVLVARPTDEKEDRSVHGLTRALIQNMVTGVSQGYRKILLILGVGYKAVKSGKDLQLYVGYSLMPGKGTPQAKYIISDTDTVKISVPNEAEIKAQGIDQMTTEKINGGIVIVVEGANKQEVGQMAAVIRGKRPPEPYHGKGIRYIDETVRRKAGKTGK
ncbi:MAG: 50S ribosomal protein L6 [Ruminococcaceae bacterium]|nr:50S ribosomal protein L6 [Oscillospiraceae bacterium]